MNFIDNGCATIAREIVACSRAEAGPTIRNLTLDGNCIRASRVMLIRITSEFDDVDTETSVGNYDCLVVRYGGQREWKASLTWKGDIRGI